MSGKSATKNPTMDLDSDEDDEDYVPSEKEVREADAPTLLQREPVEAAPLPSYNASTVDDALAQLLPTAQEDPPALESLACLVSKLGKQAKAAKQQRSKAAKAKAKAKDTGTKRTSKRKSEINKVLKALSHYGGVRASEAVDQGTGSGSKSSGTTASHHDDGLQWLEETSATARSGSDDGPRKRRRVATSQSARAAAAAALQTAAAKDKISIQQTVRFAGKSMT